MSKNMFIVMLIAFLFGCSSTIKSQRYMDGINGHVFPKEYDLPALIRFDDAEERYTPSYQDIEKSEILLDKQLEIINTPLADQGIKGCPIIHKNLNKYRRQYIGYLDRNGDRILWVNFFIAKDRESVKNMKKDVVIVLDGCSQYWNVKINLDQGVLYDLHINGVS